MTYTKEQRKAIAAAFRAGKRKLWNGKGYICPYAKDEYICHALASVDGPGSRDARDVVMDRLEGCSFFDVWLRRKVPPSQLTSELVQAHRHAWLDKLIEEFSS